MNTNRKSKKKRKSGGKSKATYTPQLINITEMVRITWPDLEATSVHVSRMIYDKHLNDSSRLRVKSLHEPGMTFSAYRFILLVVALKGCMLVMGKDRPGSETRPFRISFRDLQGMEFTMERDSSGRVAILFPEESGLVATEVETEWTVEPIVTPGDAGKPVLLGHGGRLVWAKDGRIKRTQD